MRGRADRNGNSEASILLQLSSPTAIDAYVWRTAHTSNLAADDPVRWVVEGLVRGERQLIDQRDAFSQDVSTERRQAALGAMLTSSNLQFVGQTREISSGFAFQQQHVNSSGQTASPVPPIVATDGASTTRSYLPIRSGEPVVLCAPPCVGRLCASDGNARS